MKAAANALVRPAGTCLFCAVLLALMVLAIACTKKDQVVVIHIFRDPGAPAAGQLTRAIEHFQSLKVRTRTGKLIVVTEAAPGYVARLRDLGAGLTPDLVILNSRRDAENNAKLQDELARALELGGEGRRCLALIPSWVSGDELAASQMFLNFLISSGELW